MKEIKINEKQMIELRVLAKDALNHPSINDDFLRKIVNDMLKELEDIYLQGTGNLSQELSRRIADGLPWELPFLHHITKIERGLV